MSQRNSYCKHQFIKVRQLENGADLDGVIVVCVNCGQTREVWSNGEVKIIHE